MKKIDTTDIKKKQKRLKEASKELKAHFVGIDHIIDHVVKSPTNLKVRGFYRINLKH